MFNFLKQIFKSFIVIDPSIKRYNEVTPENQEEICKECARMYPDKKLSVLKSAFETVNPHVKWNNKTKEWDFYAIYQKQFENFIK